MITIQGDKKLQGELLTLKCYNIYIIYFVCVCSVECVLTSSQGRWFIISLHGAMEHQCDINIKKHLKSPNKLSKQFSNTKSCIMKVTDQEKGSNTPSKCGAYRKWPKKMI